MYIYKDDNSETTILNAVPTSKNEMIDHHEIILREKMRGYFSIRMAKNNREGENERFF